MRSLGWALTKMTGVLVKMGYLETVPCTRRITCEDEGVGGVMPLQPRCGKHQG